MVFGIQRQGGKAKILRINPAGDTHRWLQTHAIQATGFLVSADNDPPAFHNSQSLLSISMPHLVAIRIFKIR
jgi:hypothetical protein